MSMEPVPLGVSSECGDGGPVPAIAIPNECDDCVGLDCADAASGTPGFWAPEKRSNDCGPKGCDSQSDRDGSGDGGDKDGDGGDDGNGDSDSGSCCCTPTGTPVDGTTVNEASVVSRSVSRKLSQSFGGGKFVADETAGDGDPVGTGEPGSSCPEPSCCEDSGDGNGGDGNGGTGGGDGTDCKGKRPSGAHCHDSRPPKPQSGVWCSVSAEVAHRGS